MSQYDDETGLVLSDEEEIVKEAALDEDEIETDTSTEGNELTGKEQKAPRINKKRILLVVAILASLIVLVSIIRPSEKKRKSKNDGIASELTVPDFSTSKQPYEEPDENLVELVVDTPPVYMPPPEKKRTQVQTQTVGSRVSNEEKSSPTTILPVVQGRLLGQGIQGGGSVEPQGNNPYEQALSALGMPMNQDEYTASRLSAIGGLGGLGGGGSPGFGQSSDAMNYQQQNMQDNKQSFYNSGREGTVTGEFIGNDTLWNGSIIPGVLITGINTDLPGDVQARVTENIYDSLTGKKLLIPQGSVLIASYNSSVSFAQSRVQIAWNTLIRPDGFQVSLGNMNGVDVEGYSGTEGKVNEHLFQYVKAAGIISAFTILNGEFAASTEGTNNETLKNLIAANQGVVNQMGTKIIERTMNIQPTLTVRSGTKINIMLNKNVRLPPVQDYTVKAAYKR